MSSSSARPTSVVTFAAADGPQLTGQLDVPEHVVASVVLLHPLPTHGGSMDLMLFTEAALRLPERGIAVLRFNTRGTGASTGTFDDGVGEGHDVAAAVQVIADEGLPAPWLAGWSFGADMALRHGLLPGVQGAVLMAPPLRWAGDDDIAAWANARLPLVCLVPEFDDYLRPAEAAQRFPDVRPLPGAHHLLTGFTDRVLAELANAVIGRTGSASPGDHRDGTP